MRHFAGAGLLWVFALGPGGAQAHFEDSSFSETRSCERALTAANSNPSFFLTDELVLRDVRHMDVPFLHLRDPSIRAVGPIYFVPRELHLSSLEERRGTSYYADAIHESNNEVILFLPAFEGQNVHGFDGVIYDAATGEPVANYSHKSLFFQDPDHFEETALALIDRAFAKARKFSLRSQWLESIVGRGDRRISSEESASRYRAHAAWVRKVTAVLGMNWGREDMHQRLTRVLIDVLPEGDELASGSLAEFFSPDFVREVRRRVNENSDLIEAVVFQRVYENLEIRAGALD